MNIYFIRHGESEQTDKVFQSPHTLLSKIGWLQAHKIMSKLADTSLDLLVSSPYTRALQTAQIMG